MARTAVAIDSFTRANAALGAPDWAQLNAVDAGNAQIVGNVIFGGNSGQSAAARWVGAGTFTADQYSSIVISTGGTGTANYGMGVIARASADADTTRDYYYVYVADVTVFGVVLNGADTLIGSSGTPSWTAGDRLELECEGTTVRVMKNGVALGGAFTVTNAVLATGNPGVLARGDPGIISGDDWEGGNLTSIVQLLAPVQDISAGTWLTSAGSPAEMWQMLDGEKSPDADYCYTPAAGTMEVKFSPGSTPTVQTGHVVRYRLRGNGSADAIVKLKQGSTVIVQWTETNVPMVDTDYERTLDSSPSFSITDYSDLRLSVEAVP